MHIEALSRRKVLTDVGILRSHYVNKIVFSPLSFVDWKAPTMMDQDLIITREDQLSASHSPSPLKYGRHLPAYRNFIELQRYLSHEARDFQILMRAFRKLQRLSEIDIEYRNEFIGAEEIVKAFGFSTSYEITLEGNHSFGVLIRALVESQAKIQVFQLGFGWDARGPEAKRTQSSLLETGRLRLCCDWQLPVLMTARSFSRGTEGLKKDCFADLRIFRYERAHSERGYNRETAQENADALGRLFQSSRALESVSVGPLVESNWSRRSMPLLEHLFRSRYQTISFLELDYVKASEKHFVRFFDNVSSTIVTVKLYHFFFGGNGQWSNGSDVLRQLRQFRFPLLQLFCLGTGYYNGSAGKHVEEYIKGLSDVNPLEN